VGHTRQSCRPPLKGAECLTCSIGIGPSVSLGKVGSDLQKPDGLVVITKDNLPEVLLRLNRNCRPQLTQLVDAAPDGDQSGWIPTVPIT
jgi:nucleotidyltransferase/DNA polymerase involved in DNA repair